MCLPRYTPELLHPGFRMEYPRILFRDVYVFISQERRKEGAHNWARVYSVVELPGGEKVLTKNQAHGSNSESAIAAAKEDFFNILREGHLATGHGKEHVLFRHLSRRFFNITREMCSIFANDCTTCIKMRSYSKTPRAGHKPILTEGFGSRGQVDLIDMQSNDFNGMRWLLTYVDHGTKYAVTCAVPNKQVTMLLMFMLVFVGWCCYVSGCYCCLCCR